MSKVTINAEPHLLNTNVLADDDVLEAVFKTLGKNDQLLKEVKMLFEKKVIDKFARYTSALNSDDDYSGIVVLTVEEQRVFINVFDKANRNVGQAWFDKDEFFSCLD